MVKLFEGFAEGQFFTFSLEQYVSEQEKDQVKSTGKFKIIFQLPPIS